MKKSLIALAVLATAGTAFAQSTVTISGNFGSAYQSFDTAAAFDSGQLTTQANAVTAYNLAQTPTTETNLINAFGAVPAVPAKTSKGIAPVTDGSIKLTMVEDLGGGLRLIVASQFQVNDARGGGLTKEDSSLTLAGGFGSLTFANTRSANTAIAANVFASWVPNGGFYRAVDARAEADALAYTSPAIMPGLTVGVVLAEATQGTGTSVVKATLLNANYAQGPLTVAATHKTFSGFSPTQVFFAKKTNTELAATYNFGVANVGLGYGSALTNGGAHLISYGVSVPVGAITFGINGAKRGTANFYEGGVNYSLSKRTQVRAQMGTQDGGKFGGNQYRIGVYHTF